MTDEQLTENINKYFKLLHSDQTDPVTLYLEGLAPSGRSSMRSLLQSSANIFEFEGPLEQMPWPLLHYKHIAQIRSTLLKQGKAENTINATLSAFRGVMKACFNLGLIQSDQLMSINQVKRVKATKLPSGRCLSDKEIKKLISSCRKDKSIIGKRDIAIIALMLSTGLRRSEVINIDIEHYNSLIGEILIISGKGNKQRIVYIPDKVIKMISPWLKIRTNKPGKLFLPINNNKLINRIMTSQALYDLIKKRSLEANLIHCSPHDFRRTYITMLLSQGVDINTVRKMAGHTDIQTTSQYDHRDLKQQKSIIMQAKFF